MFWLWIYNNDKLSFIAIDAALSMSESLLFGVLFYLAFQVSDITEMKRPSKAGTIDTPSTQRRLLNPNHVEVNIKEPNKSNNGAQMGNKYYGDVPFSVCWSHRR